MRFQHLTGQKYGLRLHLTHSCTAGGPGRALALTPQDPPRAKHPEQETASIWQSRWEHPCQQICHPHKDPSELGWRLQLHIREGPEDRGKWAQWRAIRMVRTGALALGVGAKGTGLAPNNSEYPESQKRHQFLASPKHPPHWVFLPFVPYSLIFTTVQFSFCLFPLTNSSKDSLKWLIQSNSVSGHLSVWLTPTSQPNSAQNRRYKTRAAFNTHSEERLTQHYLCFLPSYLPLKKGIFFQVWEKMLLAA